MVSNYALDAYLKHVQLLTGALMLGCSMGHKMNMKVLGEVTDETGAHRLLLKYVERPLPRTRSGKAYDFHSLVWESKHETKWTVRTAISEADFQADAEFRRWISEVHSLDPGSGHAVVKVGEEGPPDSAGAVHVTYSWREWDIVGNKEVRLIRVCQSPFDAF